MGVGLNAAQIREAMIFENGVRFGKIVGYRAARRELAAATRKGRGERIVEATLREVARRYRVSEAELTGRARPQLLTYPRFLASFVASRLSGLGSVELGRLLERDHTTILYQIRRFCDAAAVDPKRMAEARAVAKALGRDLPGGTSRP
jgi:chromosomal replication initiation ATPase DnaA